MELQSDFTNQTISPKYEAPSTDRFNNNNAENQDAVKQDTSLINVFRTAFSEHPQNVIHRPLSG